MGFFSLISATTFSALRKRYLRPNIAVTEQKLQAKGQPQLVMMGVLDEALVADDEREVGERQGVEVGAALVQLVVHGAARRGGTRGR